MTKRGPKVGDLVGKKFSRLTVMKQVIYPEGIRKGKLYWLCQCDCGKTVVVLSGNLKNSHTTSCGCYRRELFIKRYRGKSIPQNP
jgi:hypothetical protein